MHSFSKAQLTNLDYHKLFPFLVNFVFPGLFIISNWYLNQHSQNRPNIVQSNGKNMGMSVTKECLEHGQLKCFCLVDQSKEFSFLHEKHGGDGKKKAAKAADKDPAHTRVQQHMSTPQNVIVKEIKHI